MTDNQKLQLWQAGILGNPDELQVPYNTPDYLNDDAAAMSLLDTLVDKGFEYNICGNTRKVDFRIYKDDVGVCMSIKPARCAAVVSAVLEMIEKEDV